MDFFFPRVEASVKQAQSYVEKHFVEIAFLVSTFVMLIFAPAKLFAGALIGYFLHAHIEPQLKTNQKITLMNSIFTIIGAMATLVSLTPAGSGSGFIFHALPFVSSLAVGSTLYRSMGS
jgi:hypothetical protein